MPARASNAPYHRMRVNQNTKIFISENTLANVQWKIPATLSRRQSVTRVTQIRTGKMFIVFQNFAELYLKMILFFKISQIRASHWKNIPFSRKWVRAYMYALVRSDGIGPRSCSWLNAEETYLQFVCSGVTSLVTHILSIEQCKRDVTPVR